MCDVIEAERLFAPEDAEYNAGFVDQMVKLGTENTESGKYAYHFSTFTIFPRSARMKGTSAQIATKSKKRCSPA